jgi:ribosomal protein S18 acetylase RimI-like enzyme
MNLEASRMLARAFVTNPLHIAAFGRDELLKNETFFGTGLTVMKGPKFVALDEARVVGFVHWVRSTDCQLALPEKLRMMPAMTMSFGPGPALRVAAWLSAWARHDPGEPHVHLGPIGVDPGVQRQHIGQELMERYCRELDQEGALGYLETDRPGNVEFYRRFGFEITAEISILGVPNYFMKRVATRS